jgi:hypothetical protein
MFGVRLSFGNGGSPAKRVTELQGAAFYRFLFFIASTSFWMVPITAMAMTPRIESWMIHSVKLMMSIPSAALVEP